MRFLVIEKVFSHDRHVLEARERFWREQYGCTNRGLNVNRTWDYRSILFLLLHPFFYKINVSHISLLILGVLQFSPIHCFVTVLLAIMVTQWSPLRVFHSGVSLCLCFRINFIGGYCTSHIVQTIPLTFPYISFPIFIK